MKANSARCHKAYYSISSLSEAMNLKTLGWNSSLKSAFREHQEAGLEPARIVSQDGNRYTALGEKGEFKGKVSGRMRYECTQSGDLPAVGDWVATEVNTEIRRMIIHAILPRHSKFARATYNKGNYEGDQVICANVDFIFIVVGLDEEFNANRLERYLAQASASGSKPVVILSKSDICRNLTGILK